MTAQHKGQAFGTSLQECLLDIQAGANRNLTVPEWAGAVVCLTIMLDAVLLAAWTAWTGQWLHMVAAVALVCLAERGAFLLFFYHRHHDRNLIANIAARIIVAAAYAQKEGVSDVDFYRMVGASVGGVDITIANGHMVITYYPHITTEVIQ